jgi:hypothetical protein
VFLIQFTISGADIMSFYGTISFFTENKPTRPQELVMGAIDSMGPKNNTVFSISKTIEILHEWEDYKKYRDYGTETYYMKEPLSQWRFLDDTSIISQEFIETFDYNDSVLDISAYPTSLSKICISVSEISESIRGNYNINHIGFSVGYHDIYTSMEDQDNEDGRFWGRAFFEFRFGGKGFPNFLDEFRETVFNLPEIIDFKKKIEAFAGPIKTCAYWD